jgi:hypothetical protein
MTRLQRVRLHTPRSVTRRHTCQRMNVSLHTKTACSPPILPTASRRHRAQELWAPALGAPAPASRSWAPALWAPAPALWAPTQAQQAQHQWQSRPPRPEHPQSQPQHQSPVIREPSRHWSRRTESNLHNHVCNPVIEMHRSKSVGHGPHKPESLLSMLEQKTQNFNEWALDVVSGVIYFVYPAMFLHRIRPLGPQRTKNRPSNPGRMYPLILSKVSPASL